MDSMASSIQLLFLGTGTSTGHPCTPCLTLTQPYPAEFINHLPLPAPNPTPSKGEYNPSGSWPNTIPCACCRAAVSPDVPEGWKNRRGNTGLVLRKRGMQGEWRNVVVDVGKTFREQSARFFPRWGVSRIDAVIITHAHADAYLGLEELLVWCHAQNCSIPVYVNQETYVTIQSRIPDLFRERRDERDTPCLRFCIIGNDKDFEVEGIKVRPLPVEHGVNLHNEERQPLICLGFMFDESIIYLSDVSDIPESTWARMLNCRPRSHHTIRSAPPSDSKPRTEHPALPVLVIDALWPLLRHASHIHFVEALRIAARLKPSITYLVDMAHPVSHYMWEELCASVRGEHGPLWTGSVAGSRHPDDEQAQELVRRFWTNEEVKGIEGEVRGWGGRVEPAWDGLVLEVNGQSGEGEGYEVAKGKGGSGPGLAM